MISGQSTHLPITSLLWKRWPLCLWHVVSSLPLRYQGYMLPRLPVTMRRDQGPKLLLLEFYRKRQAVNKRLLLSNQFGDEVEVLVRNRAQKHDKRTQAPREQGTGMGCRQLSTTKNT